MGIESVPGSVRRLEPPMLEIDKEAHRRALIAKCCQYPFPSTERTTANPRVKGGLLEAGKFLSQSYALRS
jgi:hypothetical protein